MMTLLISVKYVLEDPQGTSHILGTLLSQGYNSQLMEEKKEQR